MFLFLDFLYYNPNQNPNLNPNPNPKLIPNRNLYIYIILYVSIRALVPQTLTDEHTQKIFAVEFFKICRYKTFWMRIFKRTTFLLFRCCTIHVKLCVLATHPLEIEFKSRVDMGSDSNRYTAQRYNP